MPQVQGQRLSTQGLNLPIISLNPASFINTRVAPGTNQHAEQSTLWIRPRNAAGTFLGEAYLNVGNNAGAAQWGQILFSGSAGIFTTLVSTGQFNLDTTAVGANTLGNTTGATSLAISVGTGGFSVDGVGASNYAIGASTTTGTIAIGGTAQTGTLTIAGGNAAQTINIAASGTGAKTINLGATGSVDVVNIGSTTGASQLALKGGTAGIQLASAGQTAMDAQTDTVASPTATTVINARVAYAVYTGFTTAAAANQVFIITNNKITIGSGLLVTAMNLGANDAQMTVTRVQPGAGTVSITLTNFGAAALNGDVMIQVWALD